jgi:hypothetical protein
LIEKIGIVLIARTVWISALGTPPAVHAHPWCSKGPRVLDKHRNVNTIAIYRKLPPLYHMELFSMGRPVIIDKGPCRNSNGVNNQGIAIFIIANRFTVPQLAIVQRQAIIVTSTDAPRGTAGTAVTPAGRCGNPRRGSFTTSSSLTIRTRTASSGCAFREVPAY